MSRLGAEYCSRLMCLQGRPLPRPVAGDGADAGVWVVGMSKESEADRAGIQQGDQLLQVGIGACAGR